MCKKRSLVISKSQLDSRTLINHSECISNCFTCYFFISTCTERRHIVKLCNGSLNVHKWQFYKIIIIIIMLMWNLVSMMCCHVWDDNKELWGQVFDYYYFLKLWWLINCKGFHTVMVFLNQITRRIFLRNGIDIPKRIFINFVFIFIYDF